MDAPEPVTPARNVVTNDDDGVPKSQPSPKVDGSVVLAHPALVSKTLVLTVDADGAQSQKNGGTPIDVLNVQHSFYLP